jgi:hypothetical protein
MAEKAIDTAEHPSITNLKRRNLEIERKKSYSPDNIV